MFNFVHDYCRCLCENPRFNILYSQALFIVRFWLVQVHKWSCLLTAVSPQWKLIFSYQWGRQKGQKVGRYIRTKFVSIHLLTLKQISQQTRNAFPETTSSNKQWCSFFLPSGSVLSGNNMTLSFSTSPQAELGQCQLHLYLQKQQKGWTKWKWKELEQKYLKNKSLYGLTVLQRQI